MSGPAASLSPRQRDCLRLVWERQATSKEIAAELRISKSTVDGYIAEAVEQLGARDRREAAAMAFGNMAREPIPDFTPRAASGGDPARVADVPRTTANPSSPMGRAAMPVPWRTRQNPRNSLLLGPTLGWIAVIAFGSIAALALATSIGNGLPSVAKPIYNVFHRLQR